MIRKLIAGAAIAAAGLAGASTASAEVIKTYPATTSKAQAWANTQDCAARGGTISSDYRVCNRNPRTPEKWLVETYWPTNSKWMVHYFDTVLCQYGYGGFLEQGADGVYRCYVIR